MINLILSRVNIFFKQGILYYIVKVFGITLHKADFIMSIVTQEGGIAPGPLVVTFVSNKLCI